MLVVLVEDHVAYRESFRVALRSLTSFVVVAEAGNARSAIEAIEQHRPELAVIDFRLPDSNGIALARELRRRRSKTRLLMLGRRTHPLFVRDAINAGIGGFALKQDPLEEILHAMKQVAAGTTYISPSLQESLSTAGLGEETLATLSHREREVLFLLVEGMSSKEIARALFLSAKTVDAHRLHINRKLGVHTPAELARLVADQGVLAG